MNNDKEAGRSTTLRGTSFKLNGPELRVGDQAPDFDVVDASLQKIDLTGTGDNVRIFSVIPSLDTPVCDAQTRRFEEAAEELPNVKIYTVSMDLPFAQKRWCGSYGINRVMMLSDHKDGSFGEHYGTLIADLRIESRAIFVLDQANRIRYVEYVQEVGDHPNYVAALAAARQVQQEMAAGA